MRRAWLAIICAACTDGWHEDSPVDQGHTRYHAIASTDERLAFALEPRFVHREEHGVLTLGYTIRLTGPTVVVAGDAITPLVVGHSRVALGATRAWVLQQTGDQWDAELPGFDPPPTPYVHAAAIDRATFAVTSQVALDPPLDTALVLGDELFDVPASGAADSARDLAVRRRTDDGGAIVLHAGRGFGSAVCPSAFVYQATPDTVRIVALPSAATSELAGIHLVGLACAGDRIAIEAIGTDDHTPRVLFYGLASQQTVATLAGLTGLLAVRADGSTVLALRADRTVVEASAHDVTSLGIVAPRSPMTPSLVGDQAIVEATDDVHVIDLGVGGIGPGIGTMDTLAWPAAGGFARMIAFPALSALGIATAAGTRELPLPEARNYASLVTVAGSRLYIAAYADNDGPLQLISYNTETLFDVAPFPVCDAASVLAGGPCR